jgi:hypothetical protein
MAFGGPTMTCPRCNTVLAAQAQFCSTCGLQFSAAAPPTSLAAPPPLNTFQFPVVPPAYPQAPPPAAPSPRGKGKLIILLVIAAVVLVGGGVGGFLLLRHSSNPGSVGFDTHGLEASVPLPNNVTFVLRDSASQSFPAPAPIGTISITIDRWLWTVAGSNPTAVQQFYIQSLPGTGWTQITPTDNGDDKGVTACQGTQEVLFIDASSRVTPAGKAPVTAPSGGSVLSIGLANSVDSPELLAFTCAGQLPTLPTP